MNLEQRDLEGCTLLLQALSVLTGKEDPRIIALLLERGANVHARNIYRQDCLSIFVCRRKNSRSLERSSVLKDKQVLLLLIQAVADVYARCGFLNRISVSGLAYGTENDPFPSRVGSYSGDLWNSVLSESGHDLAEFRARFPRRAGYTLLYTRDDFEMLWRGREEFCPYYDDPPVWTVEGGGKSEDIASEGGTDEGGLDHDDEVTYYNSYLDSYLGSENGEVGHISEEHHTWPT